MTDAERAQLQQRLTALQAKADGRRDEPGYRANVAELDAEIARLQAQLAE